MIFMKRLKSLKTSDKVSLYFSLFNLIGVIVIILIINISYFFIWYFEQKSISFDSIDKKYDLYNKENNLDEFLKFVFTKDVLFIPEDWREPICSKPLEEKMYDAVSIMSSSYVYIAEWKTFFIFSKYYPWFWELKILFDISPYISSQIIIIYISLFIILIYLLLSYFIWKFFVKKSLKDLIYISNHAKKLDIVKNDYEKISLDLPLDDEIKILSDALNFSFEKIKKQTDNLYQFITDVSHEFKTPLMIINSKIDLYNKMIEKWKDDKSSLDDLLSAIKKSIKKLNKHLETMFYISRLEEWFIKLNKEKLDVGVLIKDLSLDLVSNQSKTVDFDFSNIKAWIIKQIDVVIFSIIFANLVSNAIKFSDTDNIKIEIWLDYEKFYVKDFWVWISGKEQDNIFSKFYRTDINKEGFWVWLFMVKRLSNLHDFSISVESRLNKYSIFFVYFNKDK